MPYLSQLTLPNKFKHYARQQQQAENPSPHTCTELCCVPRLETASVHARNTGDADQMSMQNQLPLLAEE